MRARSPALTLPFACALGLTLLACSSDKPPEAPANPPATDTPPPEPAEPTEGPKPEPKAPAPPKVTGSAAPVPDDYTVNERDCVELGNAYGNVTRADLEAELSPKITAKQRAATMQKIEGVATKMKGQAENACRSSMLGHSADPASLKCALDAKTAKAFDTCLNGSTPPPKK